MIRIATATIAAALALSAFSGQMAAQNDARPANLAHVHMDHVTTGWTDTPDGMGLLPAAQAEAEVAARHVALALQQPGNLDWLKTHTGHVLHAVDPSVETTGPGLGYGVIRASGGVAKHIGFAVDSEGASPNVKTHATHVATSANNTVARAQEIVALAKEVQAASDAATAAARVREIERLVGQLEAGADANGDGKTTWIEGEGGLGQVELHMDLMRKGEGQSG